MLDGGHYLMVDVVLWKDKKFVTGVGKTNIFSLDGCYDALEMIGVRRTTTSFFGLQV